MLSEPIEAERLVRRINLPIRTNLRVTMFRRPKRYVRVKAFAIAHNRCEQQQIATAFRFRPQTCTQLIACLRFDGELAVRAVLRSEPRKQQANEMINLGNGRNGALTAAARVSLLDTHGRWQARD